MFIPLKSCSTYFFPTVTASGDVPISAPYLHNFPPFSHPAGVSELMAMIRDTWETKTGTSGLLLGFGKGWAKWGPKNDSNNIQEQYGLWMFMNVYDAYNYSYYS